MIIVLGSEFWLWTFTVITQWSLLKGLSVTFLDRMGCKEGDAMVRSNADFEVVVVYLSLVIVQFNSGITIAHQQPSI